MVYDVRHMFDRSFFARGGRAGCGHLAVSELPHFHTWGGGGGISILADAVLGAARVAMLRSAVFPEQ